MPFPVTATEIGTVECRQILSLENGMMCEPTYLASGQKTVNNGWVLGPPPLLPDGVAEPLHDAVGDLVDADRGRGRGIERRHPAPNRDRDHEIAGLGD
jgi:hypothetical protein